VRGSFYPNYSRPIPDHYRTSAFAIRREAAERLFFPASLRTKWDCYRFEWADAGKNLTAQIRKQGLEAVPVCDPGLCWTESSRYIWDLGCLNMLAPDPRCRKDLWSDFNRMIDDPDCAPLSAV